jgi:hypothetical protein
LDINAILFIVLIFALLLAAMFIVPRWRLKRAIRQVVQILQEHNATDSKNAKTIDGLGLRPKAMMEGMFRGRDYKPYALNILMRAEIIQQTEDGKLYLSEEKLRASGLEKSTSYYR